MQSITRYFHFATFALGGLMLLAPFIANFIGYGAPGFGRMDGAIILIGLAIGMISLDLRSRRWSVQLAGCTVVLLAASCLSGIYVKQNFPTLFSLIGPGFSLNLFEDDPFIGYKHISGIERRHYFSNEYSALYTIDENGDRLTPSPKTPLASIVIVGGSFTFGHGVNDDETFSYHLSQRWPGYRVVNKGVMAYGTLSAFQSVQNYFNQNPSADYVLYGWTPSHFERNYRSKRNLSLYLSQGKKRAHYELIGGELKFVGLIHQNLMIDDSDPILRQNNFDYTLAFLREMRRLSEARGAQFHFLRLTWGKGPNSKTMLEDEQKLLKQLRLEQFSIVDASTDLGHNVPKDGHPDSMWNEIVAEKIVAHPAFAHLSELALP